MKNFLHPARKPIQGMGILALSFLMIAIETNAFYAHVTGPGYTCPNSELNYQYDDDYGGGNVELSITNGLIFNTVTQTWVNYWFFYEGDLTVSSFIVKWNSSAIGTIGNIHIKVCDHTATFICSNGDKNVTFGASPGSPIISGSGSILNCANEQQSYTPVSVPENWQLVSWNYSSNIQQVNGTLNPKLVKGVNTSANGMETLTGVFNFVTGGNTCSTQNVSKSIWLGKPGAASQVVDGSGYYAGYPICPGNHWVGVTWNGPVTSTLWSVTSGITYTTTNTICNFTFPTSETSVAITVNATNGCGTSSNTSYYLTKKSFGCGSFLVSISPNPSSNDLNVKTFIANETDGSQYDVVAEAAELLDEQNTRVLSLIPTEATFNLDISQIRNGVYYLHIRFGKDDFVKRIIIKK